MISLKNVKKIYNREKVNAFEALHDVSLDIDKGEMVAIVGTSGAGKSTLLHILALIDDLDEGSYELNGVPMNGLSESKRARIRNKQIGIIMQDYALVEDFTAIENVVLPLDFDKYSKVSRRRKRELAMEALHLVQMDDQVNNKCNQLSGGQKQRTAIARAIVNDPDILIADEPTGALDSQNAYQIMDIFCGLKKSGKTILIVTHDMNIAQKADRIIHLKDGRIVV